MDVSTPAAILSFLESQSYLIIFWVIFIEGPIITYIAAFAASMGFFNVFIIFLISIAGNCLCDVALYIIGRIGKRTIVRGYVKGLLDSKRIVRIKEFLKENPGKTLTVIKLTPSLPTPGLILAGLIDVPVGKFIYYSLVITTAYSAVLSFLGYYSGVAFMMLAKYFRYGQYVGAALVLIVVLAFVFAKPMIPKVTKKIENI
jgi:membrane protein DedA with SNARE-associated domain